MRYGDSTISKATVCTEIAPRVSCVNPRHIIGHRKQVLLLLGIHNDACVYYLMVAFESLFIQSDNCCVVNSTVV